MRKNQALGCRVYEPTRKDIQPACKEIQATWSPRARAKRVEGAEGELGGSRRPSGSPPSSRPPARRVVAMEESGAMHCGFANEVVG